jgi:hypothetical protein
LNNRTSSSLTPRDYDGPHLHIPLDFIDWSEPGSPEPTYAVSLKRLPEPWEPLVCQLRNVVIDPELFTIEVTAFGFQRSFEWNPDKPTIEFAIPWGYMGLRSDEEFEALAVLLRDKQTGRGTYLELSWTYLYRNAIPQQLPSVLAPTPPAPTQALSALPLPGETSESDRPPLPPGAPALGTFEKGGYFFGITVEQDGTAYKLYVAPRRYEMLGRLVSESWKADDMNHPLRRCIHRTDSYANTELLRDDSPLARTVLGLEVDGVGGWSIPAVDVAELMYRNLHSGYRPWRDQANVRDGDNGTSWPRGLPYEDDEPVPSAVKAFRRYGDEAFDYHQSCHISTVSRPRQPFVYQLAMMWGKSAWNPESIGNRIVRPVRRERFS